jgi:hypothetical protein
MRKEKDQRDLKDIRVSRKKENAAEPLQLAKVLISCIQNDFSLPDVHIFSRPSCLGFQPLAFRSPDESGHRSFRSHIPLLPCRIRPIFRRVLTLRTFNYYILFSCPGFQPGDNEMQKILGFSPISSLLLYLGKYR